MDEDFVEIAWDRTVPVYTIHQLLGTAVFLAAVGAALLYVVFNAEMDACLLSACLWGVIPLIFIFAGLVTLSLLTIWKKVRWNSSMGTPPKLVVDGYSIKVLRGGVFPEMEIPLRDVSHLGAYMDEARGLITGFWVMHGDDLKPFTADDGWDPEGLRKGLKLLVSRADEYGYKLDSSVHRAMELLED